MTLVAFPYVVLLLLRSVVIVTVIAVDLRAPRLNFRILTLCLLGVAITVTQAVDASRAVTYSLSIPFWGLLAFILIRKIRWDLRTVRSALHLLRMENRRLREQVASLEGDGAGNP